MPSQWTDFFTTFHEKCELTPDFIPTQETLHRRPKGLDMAVGVVSDNEGMVAPEFDGRHSGGRGRRREETSEDDRDGEDKSPKPHHRISRIGIA